ncbi:MAG: MarR family transcriptional regulator [Oscillospiraceae bacterium]|nr:MarR family transcriptional regulator [Oscillospiraceae bacterium]
MEINLSNEMRQLNHLLGETNAVYHDLTVKLGLSDSSMYLLYTLAYHGGRCPLRDICRLTGISKQTLNSAVRKLEREHILYLEAANGRQKLVCLTEAGERLAEETVSKIIEAENNIFSSWKQEDVAQYLALSQRYLDAFRAEAKRISRE